MEKMKTPNQNYFNNLQTLWQSQSMPSPPPPPSPAVSPLRFAALIVVVFILSNVSFHLAPVSDISAINHSSLSSYTEVNATLTHTLIHL